MGKCSAVRILADLVSAKSLDFCFPMKKLCDKRKLEGIKRRLGFDYFLSVDSVGRSRGLGFMWKGSMKLRVAGYSQNHIDVIFLDDEGNDWWRFTGYYAYPEKTRKREAREFLKARFWDYLLPWCVGGDFNDIISEAEKCGRLDRESWML